MWITEGLAGVGADGRHRVTKMTYRYLNTLYNLGPAPEPNLTVLWSKDLPEPFKKMCIRDRIEVFLISRLPRLLAILCTGVGMSVAGLIMQQLCMNKFVSPTTGATISSAQFGILLALLFMPASTLWGRAFFAFAAALSLIHI